MDYRYEIADILQDIEVSRENLLELISASDYGGIDFAIPCFKLAANFRVTPNDVAHLFFERLREVRPEFIEDATVVGAYLNIKLKRKPFIENVLKGGLDAELETIRTANKRKKIVIDYSSINIAKDFHIGHLMSTAIGGSLYKTFAYLGYKTVGVNHIGDYGTQFGKLITAYKKWGKNATPYWEDNMDNLMELYARFHKEEENNPELTEEARYWFKKIEEGDRESRKLFKLFREITLKEAEKIYNMLSIKFDSYNGEAFYNDKMQPVVDELEQKGLLTESEGARVVDLSAYDMPPCLILKSDGASLYATRDLAAALYRKKTYKFDKNLYVVAYQQNLHFKQIFKVLELMGYDFAADCVHVPFGMVSVEGMGNLSTRKGNIIKLKDVLNTSIEKTLSVIKEKNADLENKEEIAADVGVGAVVFYMLYNSRIKDVSFSFDKALNFEGETGPYLQYTHARCCSIIAKALEESEQADAEIDCEVLCDDISFALVKNLAAFNEAALSCAENYEPSVIARYLVRLAQSFNKFYIAHRIVGKEATVLKTRLELVKRVRDTLQQGMELILLKAPTRM